MSDPLEISRVNSPKDPRVRRTRRLLQDSLNTLLESKSFCDLSITDICKQADIARVTFYQHYDSKDTLLLASVAEFFSSLPQAMDPDALDLYFETGDMSPLMSLPQIASANSSRVRLIKVSLQYVGGAVRKLMLASFLENFKAYSQRKTDLNEKEVQVLATFYVGGMLTLLEQFLSDQLDISQAELQVATLTFLRILRQGAIQSSILSDSPPPEC
ncbi:MAG: TetR/AcrR family transcriptional regulator [Cyanobacteria bacterium J06597_16]